MPNLQWSFEVLDKVSAPSRAAATATDRLDTALRRAGGGATDFEHQLDRAGRGASSASSRFGEMIGALRDIGLVAQMTFGMLDRGFEFGKFVLDALNFREQSMVGLGAVMGAAEEARAVFDRSEELAARTGRPLEEFVGAARALGNVGFGAKNIHAIQVAMADLDAVLGAGAGERFSQMMTRLQGSGDTMVGIQSLRQARELIGDQNVFKALAETMHISSQRAEELLKKHEQLGNVISKSVIEEALVRAVAEKQGGKLGETSLKMSETLPNQMESLETRVKALFATSDNVGKLKPLHDALSEINDLLSPKSESGQSIMDVIGFGATAMATTLRGAKVSLDFMLDDLRGIKDLFDFMRSGHVFDGAGDTTKSLGFSIGNGLSLGMLGKASGVIGTAETLGKMAVDALAGPGGIDAHSPSRKFERLGRYSVEGYVEGLSVSAPALNASVTHMLQPGSGGAGRSPISLTAHVEVHAGAGANSEEIAEKAKEATISGLLSAFEQLAIEGGGV